MSLRSLFILLLLSGSLPAYAEVMVEITAHVADLPAATKPPENPASLAKDKSISLLKLTPVSATSDSHAKFDVSQPQAVPGNTSVSLGLHIDVIPSITEAGTITFKGSLSDRAIRGHSEVPALATVEFTTREIYFQGSVASGRTILLRSAPLHSNAKADKSAARQLVIYLKFEKKMVTPPKAIPTAKSKSSPTKASGKSSTSKTPLKPTKKTGPTRR